MQLGSILYVAFVLAATSSPTDVEAFMKEFAAKRQGLERVQADFRQTTVFDKDTDEAAGTIFYRAPKRLLMRYEPPNATLMVDNQRFYEYEPEDRQLVIYSVTEPAQADIVFFGFDNDLEALRRSYELILERNDTPEIPYTLHITPRESAKEDAFFRSVTLYLRAEDYLPVRLEVVKEDSTVHTVFQNYKKNPPTDTFVDVLEVPKGTKVIVDDQVQEVVQEEHKRFPLNEVPAASQAVPSGGNAPTPDKPEAAPPVQQRRPTVTETPLPPPSAK